MCAKTGNHSECEMSKSYEEIAAKHEQQQQLEGKVWDCSCRSCRKTRDEMWYDNLGSQNADKWSREGY
jgi:hypothetical protein